MKHIKLYEEFVNEKAYQMTGSYGAKGIAGKLLFAFKKESITDLFKLPTFKYLFIIV